MPCNRINEQLDDYMDGTLGSERMASLENHVESCESCRTLVAAEQRLRALLRDYPVPHPAAAFFDRALIKATHVGNHHQRNRWILTGFGGAIAAGILAFIVGGMLLKAPQSPDSTPPMAGVTMALEEPRTINLVFSSATDLEDATLTVSLPDGIELEGFAGQREITWMTSLKAGKNILPLKLIATSPHGGELLARLKHEDRDRTFRIHVTVT